MKTLFNILAFTAFVAGIFAAWYGYAALSIWLALFGIGGLIAGIASDLSDMKCLTELEYENRTVQIAKPITVDIRPMLSECKDPADHLFNGLIGSGVRTCVLCGYAEEYVHDAPPMSDPLPPEVAEVAARCQSEDDHVWPPIDKTAIGEFTHKMCLVCGATRRVES